jgi:hypothetical protein
VNRIAFTFLCILIIFLSVSISSAFAEEKITLTTYYPAPIAEYCDLEAEKNFTVGEENTTSTPFTNITLFYGDVFILPQNQDAWEGLEGGSVGIGIDTPTTGTKLEVVGGLIKATGGLIIETRTNTPTAPAAGQLWLRTDISVGSGGNLIWAVTMNPSTRGDSAYSITSDAYYLYIAGSGYDESGQDGRWHMEKRSKSDGSLIWTRTSDPGSVHERARSITSDNDYLYIAGNDSSQDISQWRIEKRNKGGGLIWAQTSNPLGSQEAPESITSDNEYLYIAGFDVASSDRQWRIEKRSKSTGGLLWAQTSNPSSGTDIAYSITSDANYLYIAGWDDSPGNYQWRIEKRSKSDGGLLWAKTSNPSSFNDKAYSITSDVDYLYIAGNGNSQWRIEKRSKSTGGLIWAQTDVSPVFNYVYTITSDSDYLYIAGVSHSHWHIQKHFKSDGSLIWAQTNDFLVYDYARAITSDSDYLYIAGNEFVENIPVGGGAYYSDFQWRIEKRSKELIIDIGLRAYDGTEVIAIACEPEDAVSSALRIGKDGKVYGVALVEPTDPNASSIRIKTSSGVKALRKF